MFSTNLSKKECPIDKNNLQTGTVLQLNGYNDNTYCITGKSVSSWDNSVIYDTICIETKVKGKHESYSLKHISQKESNQIQVYITDQILFPSIVEKIMQEANEQAIRDAREKELVELQSEKTKQLKKIILISYRLQMVEK